MSKIPKPATQREMIEQLWYAVIGSNGDGIASITRRNSHDIAQLKDAMPRLDSRVSGCEDADKDVRVKKWRKQDVAIAIYSLALTAIIVADIAINWFN